MTETHEPAPAVPPATASQATEPTTPATDQPTPARPLTLRTFTVATPEGPLRVAAGDKAGAVATARAIRGLPESATVTVVEGQPISTSGKYLKGRFGITPTSAGWTTGSGNPPGVVIKGLQAWAASGAARELGGEDSETNGFENPDTGLKGLTVRLSLVINTSESVFPGLEEDTYVQDLFLYFSGFNQSPAYDIPYGVVTQAETPVEVGGQVKQTVTVKSKGPYAGPTSPVLNAGSPYKIARPVLSPDY